MGDYTKANLILPIKKDADRNTIGIISSLFCGDELSDLEEKNLIIPEHPFFEKGNRIWFPNSGGSYYFTGTVNSRIRYDDLGTYAMVLHIDTDFKNYGDEIDRFLDWVKPYLDIKGTAFLGYSQYEYSLNPTLYYYDNGDILSIKTNYFD